MKMETKKGGRGDQRGGSSQTFGVIRSFITNVNSRFDFVIKCMCFVWVCFNQSFCFHIHMMERHVNQQLQNVYESELSAELVRGTHHPKAPFPETRV
jgi:hypothetical protein